MRGKVRGMVRCARDFTRVKPSWFGDNELHHPLCQQCGCSQRPVSGKPQSRSGVRTPPISDPVLHCLGLEQRAPRGRRAHSRAASAARESRWTASRRSGAPSVRPTLTGRRGRGSAALRPLLPDGVVQHRGGVPLCLHAAVHVEAAKKIAQAFG